MTAFKLGHVNALDGLRGVAVLAVIVFHAHPGALVGGFLGVDVFFVLSGFLITSLALHEIDRTGRLSLRRFYARRALRLLPALFLMVAVVLAAYALLKPEELPRLLREAGVVLVYASNWTRAFLTTMPATFGHTWSLAIEEQFYLLWPPLLLLLLRWGGRRVALGGAVALVAGAWGWRVVLVAMGGRPYRVYNGLDTRLDSLMIGCVAAIVLSLLTAEQLAALGKRLRLIAPLSAVTLVAFAFKSQWWMPETFQWRLGVAGLLTAAVIVGVVLSPGSLLARLLSGRWLRGVGVISYGLYLWHFPILPIAQGAPGGPWVTLAVTLAASLAAAGASYWFVERRALALRGRFTSSGSRAAVVESRPRRASEVAPALLPQSGSRN